MDHVVQLRDELHRSVHGPAWHGPALAEVLADVSPAEAAARPLRDAHTIGELALHLLAWTEEVTRRLHGGSPALPARGDWPPLPSASPAAWAEVQGALTHAQAALEEAVASFAPERLEELMGTAPPDAPLGSGVTYAAMLSGLAQHNAYHAGQVVLLKRALRSGGVIPGAPT